MDNDDKNITVSCLNKPMTLTDDKYRHTFFIKICRSDGFYNTVDIFTQKHLMLIDGYESGDPAEIAVDWPYDYPVFIQLFDYFDTYSDIVAERAVEKPGRYILKIDLNKEIHWPNYRNIRQKLFMEINEQNMNSLNRLESMLSSIPDNLKKDYAEDIKRLHYINLKLKIDRDI